MVLFGISELQNTLFVPLLQKNPVTKQILTMFRRHVYGGGSDNHNYGGGDGGGGDSGENTYCDEDHADRESGKHLCVWGRRCCS